MNSAKIRPTRRSDMGPVAARPDSANAPRDDRRPTLLQRARCIAGLAVMKGLMPAL